MSDIRIIPVTTKKGLRTFIQFYYDLYEGSKYAVPYLRFDEWNTLSKDKNPAFDFCEAQYFLAIDYSIPKVVGRIAAIINHCTNDQWNKKQVRFGWFDFIDNLEVSSKLLDAAAHWGRERGMEELVGPPWLYRYGPRRNAHRRIPREIYHVHQLQLPLLSQAHGCTGALPEGGH